MEKFLKKLLVLVAVLVTVTIAIISSSKDISTPEILEVTQQKKQNWVGLYLSGQHAVFKNDYTKASQFFSESLEARDADIALGSQILELLIASGQYEKALKLAAKINSSDESASAGLLLYANELVDEDYEGAVRTLTALSDEAKKTVIHQILLAWAQLGAKDSKAALATMASLEKQGYFEVLISFNYALLAEIAGDNPKAAEIYKKLIADREGKIPHKIAEAAYRFFVKTGDKDAAAQIIESGAKLSQFKNQENQPTIRVAAADALNEIATMLLSEQNFSKATVFFRIGLLINSDNEEAMMLLATILSHEKDSVAANKIFDEIEEESPFYYEAQMATAQNYIALENEILAKNILGKLKKEKSVKVEALMTLGDLSRQDEDFASANKFYSDAIEAASGVKKQNAFWPLYFARGVTFERLKKWEAAEKDFEKALALEPNQPDVLNYYAYSLLDMSKEERYDEAKQMLINALEQNPDDPHIIDSIGWAWFKKGDYKKAVKHLENAAAEMPYDPTINDHLGDVYWKLGRENEAVFAWERALKNKPEERFVEELKNKLANGLGGKKAAANAEDLTATPQVELEVYDSTTQDSGTR